uniref:Uncharacterized protein n=1 Tax=Oryza barthii TaxID=65489 RepID=A0A0D3F2W9_9ORYZ
MLDGEERLRVGVWLVMALALLLFSVLACGGCLASYIVLLPNEAPHCSPLSGGWTYFTLPLAF